LEKFDVLMMRAEDEAERRFCSRPARARHVTGNTKFDALAVSVPLEEDPALRQALALGGERLWVCGSTHEGEESGLLPGISILQRRACRSAPADRSAATSSGRSGCWGWRS